MQGRAGSWLVEQGPRAGTVASAVAVADTCLFTAGPAACGRLCGVQVWQAGPPEPPHSQPPCPQDWPSAGRAEEAESALVRPVLEVSGTQLRSLSLTSS